MNDSCRYNFVTTIHCARCGEQLKGTYKPDCNAKESLDGVSDQPTGAAMVHNRISVWPCKTCSSAAEEFCEAFKALQKSIDAKP